MRLALREALALGDREVVAFVGAGGKTTALFRLARELHAGGALVVVTTTTKILVPPASPDLEVVVEPQPARLLAAVATALALGRIPVVARATTAKGKLEGVPPEWVADLAALPGVAHVLVEADGAALPFADKSFDVTLSSAVILHNKFPNARKMISEMVRVSRKYLVHNEDTDVTFTRYGYDLKKTYEKMGFKIVDSKQIPVAPDPTITQFTVAELPSGLKSVRPEDVPLQYHA